MKNENTPYQYIDIHTHVNFVAYDADREETIHRAKEAGVAMINVGTQADTSLKAVELADKNENCFAIVGLHPIHTTKSHHDEKELGLPAQTFPPEKVSAGKGMKEFTSRGETFDSTIYRTMLKNPKVVGIGECGLDYYHLDSPAQNSGEFSAGEESIQKQKADFELQIALAEETRKTLMLHVRSNKEDQISQPARLTDSRSAYKDALEILRSHPKVKGNFHFFAGNWEEAKLILDAGFTMSFTGVITFARQYDEVIKNMPLDMMMSETDAPYVTPIPHRGKRNEPAYVVDVVKKIAEISNEDLEKVKQTLIKNAERVFGISLQ